MGRRDGRRGGRVPRGVIAPSPLLGMASHMWSAERVTTSSGNTTSFDPVVGAVALTSPNVQLAPVANFGSRNRLAVPFTPKGFGDYRGTIPAIGLNTTLVYACSVTAGGDSSPGAINAPGGAANSGPAIFTGASSVIGRRGNTGLLDATKGGLSYPLTAIIVFSVTAAGTALYVNAKTPVTATGAGSAYDTNTQYILGAFDLSNTFSLGGSVALAAVIPSALDATQAGALLDFYGAYYGITIGA